MPFHLLSIVFIAFISFFRTEEPADYGIQIDLDITYFKNNQSNVDHSYYQVFYLDNTLVLKRPTYHFIANDSAIIDSSIKFEYSLIRTGTKKGLIINNLSNSLEFKSAPSDSMLKAVGYHNFRKTAVMLDKKRTRALSTSEFYNYNQEWKDRYEIDSLILSFSKKLADVHFFSFSLTEDNRGLGKLTKMQYVNKPRNGIPRREHCISIKKIPCLTRSESDILRRCIRQKFNSQG